MFTSKTIKTEKTEYGKPFKVNTPIEENIFKEETIETDSIDDDFIVDPPITIDYRKTPEGEITIKIIIS